MTCNRSFRCSAYWLIVSVATASVGQAPSVFAQKAPAAGYAMPAGGKAGTTVDVRLGGYDWTPDTQFLLHEAKVKLEILSAPGEIISHLPPYWFGIKSMVNDPPLSREVAARFTLPSDLPDGPIRWCVANASGGGSCGVFMVGHDDEVFEDEQQGKPQLLPTVPVTVNGRLLRIEEVDRYRFKIERSGIVTCDLIARRLGSDFHGVLEIHDDHGRRIAEVMDTEGTDPVLTFAASAGEFYIVSVRDLDYRGFRCLTYRLVVRPGPLVVAAIPSGGRRGETRTVEFIGIGICSGRNQLESTTREVSFPNDPNQSQWIYRLQTDFGEASELTLSVSDFEELVEPVAIDGDLRPVVLPAAVTGRLSEQNRKDRYVFTNKEKTRWNIRAESRRLGSSLDLALTVIGPDGKEIAFSDDVVTTDPGLSVELPGSDHDYQIVVSDVSGPTDAERSIYRLVAHPSKRDFELRTGGTVNLPVAGGTAVLEGTVIREGRFQEPIKFCVTGLPAGVTAATDVVIGPADHAFKIPLTIDAMTSASTAFAQIQGIANCDGEEVIRTAMAPAAGTLTNRDRGSNLVSQILVTTTLKPPFKIKPTEADGGRRVHRGATHLAELVIERDAGFTGDILLDMSATQSRHRQGIYGPPVSISADRRSVEYPVFVPEVLETARTSRLGLVAMTKIPDPKGNERFVLSAVEGQITMSIEGALLKLSQSTSDLTVPIGQSFNVPLKVSRSPALAESVTIELRATDKLAGLMEAPQITLSKEKNEADWTICTKRDARLLGNQLLTARATALRNGFPVISECEIEVEFVASPTGSAGQ